MPSHKAKDNPADQLATGKDSTSTKSAGFRSFWKQDKERTVSASPGKGSPSGDGSDVSSGKGKEKSTSRVRRLLRGGNAGSGLTPNGQGEEAAGGKRRQQIYQAQKRHRNRRAEYIKSLEDELTKLRNMDSTVRNEKSSLENQNRMMKELLASHSIDAQLGAIDLAALPRTNGTDVHMSDFATVDIRHDAELGHERTFLDPSPSEDMAWSSATTGTTPEVKTKGPVQGDTWAAVDFILALEWPCQGHMPHSGINPNVSPHIECEMGKFTGHALTATAAVYESALPPPVHLHRDQEGASGQNGEGAANEKWLLPHSEIDKLVKLSEQLPLDEEQMTPAQAYSAIRQNVMSDGDLKPVLELLKLPLGAIAQCRGYGAVLPADQFWQHFETAMASLQPS